jgi:hypothetical protein
MHIFTSITSNYIPKARVLARSVKNHAPHAVFHLLLCDTPPDEFDLSKEDFDHLLLIDDLEIENRDAWIFQHNVVELCTAVKGMGLARIFRDFGADKVVFLDPDIVVFSSLDRIENLLDQHSVVLTPHQTEPENSRSAILDNEVSSLKHGVFNLGFVAVSNSAEGLGFVDWWSDRLRDFCYDDRGKGLFTDQKWIDLAPAFFSNIAILREPQFNVSTWNISHRALTGDIASGICANGEPLCFYHFSGVDSGAMKVMMDVYGAKSPALPALRSWYLEQCDAMGQKELGSQPGRFDSYSNGDAIRPAERLLYRYREDLLERFPNPFNCEDGSGGYRAWYKENSGAGASHTEEEEVLRVIRHELDAIHHSITWRVFRKLSTVYRRLGLRLGLNKILRRMSHQS